MAKNAGDSAAAPDASCASARNSSRRRDARRQAKQAPYSPAATHKETSIHKTASGFLGATVRTNGLRIVELAEERALQLDHAAVKGARETSPPGNLVRGNCGWMPGFSAQEGVKRRRSASWLTQPSPAITRGLPRLARANSCASAF